MGWVRPGFDFRQPDKKLRLLTKIQKERFQSLIRGFYREHRREMPWRGEKDPYRILISEIMLQQTQVSRVLPKYEEFLRIFPDFNSLSGASLKEVLSVWSGLGYNRRAKYLLQIAKMVVEHHHGSLPADPLRLEAFPGLGKATSRSIFAFAWNKRVAFIETNIRRVFIHHFFKDREGIADTDILALVEQTLPEKDIKNWYYALMDYGAHLKIKENVNRKSIHYKKQAKFKGSNREVRGFLVKILSKGKSLSKSELTKAGEFTELRIEEAIKNLKKEGIVGESRGRVFIV